MDLQIQSLSPAAKRWLDQSLHCRVLHVFDPVCNLINEEGEVLSLVAPAIGRGPFSAAVERGGFSEWVTILSSVQISAPLLLLGDAVINFHMADIWEAQPNWEKLFSDSIKLNDASIRIEMLLKEHAPKGSFAEIVLPINTQNEKGNAVLQRARKAINDLMPAVAMEDVEKMRQGARSLAGLGAGLTPAGDDFLLGLIHGLWATRPKVQALAVSLILAEEAVPRTNSLSAAWLNAASRGEAGEPWHELVDAIANKNSNALQNAVMRILPTGHSSGADALGGFASFIRMTVLERDGQ